MTQAANPAELANLWANLTPSAKTTILALANHCANRFTGTITIELYQGGVRQISETRRHNPENLQPTSPR
jgi:argininosuccinate synthase